MKKISVAIPCYNSSGYIINALKYPVLDDRISEIVIVDDCSNDYEELKKIVASLNSEKIKLYRNEKNSGGCYLNKYYATRFATNEWVILFDSDNIFGKEYIDALYEQKEWKPDTIYCASSGQSLPHFMWSDFTPKPISLHDFKETLGKKNIRINLLKKHFYKLFFKLPGFLKSVISRSLLMNSSSRFLALMNDCNFFIHKDTYISVHEQSQKINVNPYAADTILVNYIWLKNKKLLQVVPKMSYYHTVHPDSFWVKTVENYEKTVAWIISDLHKN